MCSKSETKTSFSFSSAPPDKAIELVARLYPEINTRRWMTVFSLLSSDNKKESASQLLKKMIGDGKRYTVTPPVSAVSKERRAVIKSCDGVTMTLSAIPSRNQATIKIESREKTIPDTDTVDSLKQAVGFDFLAKGNFVRWEKGAESGTTIHFSTSSQGSKIEVEPIIWKTEELLEGEMLLNLIGDPTIIFLEMKVTSAIGNCIVNAIRPR